MGHNHCHPHSANAPPPIGAKMTIDLSELTRSRFFESKHPNSPDYDDNEEDYSLGGYRDPSPPRPSLRYTTKAPQSILSWRRARPPKGKRRAAYFARRRSASCSNNRHRNRNSNSDLLRMILANRLTNASSDRPAIHSNVVDDDDQVPSSAEPSERSFLSGCFVPSAGPFGTVDDEYTQFFNESGTLPLPSRIRKGYVIDPVSLKVRKKRKVDDDEREHRHLLDLRRRQFHEKERLEREEERESGLPRPSWWSDPMLLDDSEGE